MSGVNSRPPEVEIAEWKGIGDVSFRIFDKPSAARAPDTMKVSEFNRVSRGSCGVAV